MYKIDYEEQLIEDQSEARERERIALDRSIGLLRAAKAAGPGSADATEAVLFTIRLWSLLIEDLGTPDNGLAKELRAQIISIGIWIVRECDKIRREEGGSFDDLIAVSEAIRDGVK